MKFTIELTPEQISTFNKLKTTREGKSDQQLFTQIVERGLYDIDYRSQRNKKVYAQFKEFKRSLKGE